MGMKVELIRDWMRKHGLNAEDVKAQIRISHGISSGTVARVLAGERANLSTIKAFAALTGIPESDLVDTERTASNRKVAVG